MEKNVYFISGIDTDAGKSYCTAYYACQLIGSGKRVITQKFILFSRFKSKLPTLEAYAKSDIRPLV